MGAPDVSLSQANNAVWLAVNSMPSLSNKNVWIGERSCMAATRKSVRLDSSDSITCIRALSTCPGDVSTLIGYKRHVNRSEHYARTSGNVANVLDTVVAAGKKLAYVGREGIPCCPL